MTEKKSFSIKLDWLFGIKREALAARKMFGVLAFNFGLGQKNYYIIDEDAFLKFNELLEREKEDGYTGG